VGWISFTADAWSSRTLSSYLTLTAHWISGGQGGKPLSLRTALIGFHRLKQKHTGKNIAQNILHFLDHASIMAKVTFVMFWYSVAY
jgi:hypothetical protein